MRNFFILSLISLQFLGCKNLSNQKHELSFSSIEIDTIISEKISIRAILPDKNKIWYAADNGKYGFYDFSKKIRFNGVLPSSNTEFRSIAKTSKSVFILNAGSPAVLFKISEVGSSQLVYNDENPKDFYDSMSFWNDQQGIAIGDPTEDCLSILITNDGGNTWKKISCDKLPKVLEGEAAFAASNSNVVTQGNKSWIVSGGKKARVFYSADKGKTWKVYETPIVQGGAMTGIFTADFYDENTGFIAGGDYEKQHLNAGNKALTADGGKTWKLVSENEGFGYASCIQYILGSRGKGLVSVGASGLWYSANGGVSWKKLLDDPALYTIRFIDPNTAFAAGKNKLIKIRFKK